jgi:hypothetical protein
LDYVMVESRGGHGEHSYGQYDVFRPRPPVGEQQREGAGPATFSVHQVQSVTRNLSTLVAQRVEPELKRVGVKGTPIFQKGVQPIAGHALIPA